MEENNIKCSFKDHSEINAIYYCQECKIYMCKNCESFHSKLLQDHLILINELFTGLCKQKNHKNKLNYFC